MADWFQLWNDDSPINEIKVANHLIELPATWKHRLANESTVHVHFCLAHFIRYNL